MNAKIKFAGGRNIAMKVPPHLWDATVQFYRDVVGLKVRKHTPTLPPTVGVEFGANQLWIDRVCFLQPVVEIWVVERSCRFGYSPASR